MATGTAVTRKRLFDPAIAALVAAMAIWGLTMVITRSALQDVGAFTILALRFGSGALVLAPFAWRKGYRFRMSLKPIFLVFGFTGIVAHNGLETVGLNFTTAGSGALVLAAAPAVTAAMSIALLKETVTRLQALGIAISIAGVLLVTSAPVGGGEAALLGNLLIFGGVIAWGVYTIQGKRLVLDLPPIVATTAGMVSAVLFLVPLAIGEIAITGAPRFSTSSVVGIAYLGVLASAIAYALWNQALDHVPASVAAPYVNLVPVIGLLAAIAVGEATAPMQIAGGVVVGIGIWTSEAARMRTAAARVATERLSVEAVPDCA